MGMIFSTNDTRAVVCTNFNSVRKIFDLSTRKLCEYIQPNLDIPYSTFRRLASGERDVSPRELQVFYEFLGVPPITFLFPWRLEPRLTTVNFFTTLLSGKDSSRIDGPHPNPVFDYLGKDTLFPYQISGMGSWLAGQMITELLTNAQSLYSLSLAEDIRDKFIVLLDQATEEYVRLTFPVSRCEDAMRRMNRPDVTLRDIGDALVWHMRTTAYIGFFHQVTSDTESNIIGRQFESITVSNALFPLTVGDDTAASRIQMLDRLERTGLEVTCGLHVPRQANSMSITLHAKDKESATPMPDVTIPIDYTDWFAFPIPAPIQPNGLGNDIELPLRELLAGDTIREALTPCFAIDQNEQAHANTAHEQDHD